MKTTSSTLWALLVSALVPTLSHAGVSLGVNGGTAITVEGGDPLTFAWAATEDTTYLRRSWGTSVDTQLATFSGSENIHAPNPAEATTYAYSVSGYDAAANPVGATVQVTVLPNPAAPAITPIVWAPALGFHALSFLSFYILPDAEIGTPYFATISATGREPITYGAVNLPDGLAVVGNTVVGTPTTNAWVQGGNFTLTATDADGFTSATLACMLTPVLYPRVLPAVTAPVVFDGGTPNADNAYDNDAGFNQERAMSGFMLKSDATVTGVRVWGTYLRRFKAATDNFTIKVYDRGPSPFGSGWASFPAAGNLLGTFTPVSVLRAKTGRTVFGVPDGEYVYDLSFGGIALKANTLYYVSVYNNTQEQWAWMSSEIQNYPSWGAWSQDVGVSFPGGSAELAFQLKAGPVVQPPPPPPVVSGTCKLAIKTSGKGSVTTNPAGTSSGSAFAAGTVVTLTASPDPKDAKSVWAGWTGDVVSLNRTITVTMNKALTVQANFR